MENNTKDWTIGDHLEDFNNPHMVTKQQVGLENVDNVRQYSELNPPPNYIKTVCSKKPDANGDIDLVKGDVNLGKVDNVKQYSEKNPPPYPVTSVNGQTGAVVITGGDDTALNAHIADETNPHKVTKAQIGLDNLDNVKQYSVQNQPPYPVTSVNGMTGDVMVSGGDDTALNEHLANKANPHEVTKAQVGLDKVDNTADLSKPISAATQEALNGKLNTSSYTATDVLNKIKAVDGSGSGLDADLLDGRQAANTANCIPILDSTGKLPIAQVPTGTSSGTVAMGNHTHSNYAASNHSHPGSSISLSTSLNDSSTSSAATPYLTYSLNNRLNSLESRLAACEAQLAPGITGAYTLDKRIITFRNGIMVQVVYA